MISQATLKNFRSHADFKTGFAPGTNVIIGQNGSGKTNILEAILMVTQGRSFRASDTAVMRYGETVSKVKLDIDGRERQLELRLDSSQVAKSFVIDGKIAKRLTFHKTIAVVLFEPNFMQIIARGPEARRDYFDAVLARTAPEYQATLNAYRRTLAQRNSLLKQPRLLPDQLFVWDIKLGELAGIIVEKRLKLIAAFNHAISGIYSKIADQKQDIAVEYITSVNPKDYTNNLMSGLQKNVRRDQELGFTSLGPHRDDFQFLLNGQPANTTASRGENRTLLLSLKIMEADLVEKARAEKPILLLDDVFSELDETRQTKLVEYFTEHQVIITSTTITPLLKGVSGQIIEL